MLFKLNMGEYTMKTTYYTFPAYMRAIIIIVFIVSIFVGIQHSIAQIYSTSEKAEIIIDPKNKQNITGNLQIALAWGELLRPPFALQRGVIHLKDAMNRYTKVNTIVDKHLVLGSNQLLKMPFVFVTSSENFNLTETEKNNVKKYILLPEPQQIDYLLGIHKLRPERFIFLDMDSSDRLLNIGRIVQEYLARHTSGG